MKYYTIIAKGQPATFTDYDTALATAAYYLLTGEQVGVNVFHITEYHTISRLPVESDIFLRKAKALELKPQFKKLLELTFKHDQKESRSNKTSASKI